MKRPDFGFPAYGNPEIPNQPVQPVPKPLVGVKPGFPARLRPFAAPRSTGNSDERGQRLRQIGLELHHAADDLASYQR